MRDEKLRRIGRTDGWRPDEDGAAASLRRHQLPSPAASAAWTSATSTRTPSGWASTGRTRGVAGQLEIGWLRPKHHLRRPGPDQDGWVGRQSWSEHPNPRDRPGDPGRSDDHSHVLGDEQAADCKGFRVLGGMIPKNLRPHKFRRAASCLLSPALQPDAAAARNQRIMWDQHDPTVAGPGFKSPSGPGVRIPTWAGSSNPMPATKLPR
jgi:hypothetical protein